MGGTDLAATDAALVDVAIRAARPDPADSPVPFAAFRAASEFPAEKLAAPALVPGIGWSDQLSFWREGYPAAMVTDTAFHRYRHYHQPTDTPEKLDYARMARVVEGLAGTLAALAAADGAIGRAEAP